MRQFLKGGEAEEYEGISIEWIRGKQAVLTVFEDGTQKEIVQLYPLQTTDEMHKKLVELGFKKKNRSGTDTKNLRQQEQVVIRKETDVAVDKAEIAVGDAMALMQQDDENTVLYAIFFGVFGSLVLAFMYSNRRKERSK